MSSIDVPAWGLKRNATPQSVARLVQQGNRLHFLADRAGICGTFSDAQRRDVDNALLQWTDLRSRQPRVTWLCVYFGVSNANASHVKLVLK